MKRKPMSEETKKKISETKKKIQDISEIRKCKDCQIEKIVTEFPRKKTLYLYQCKECRNNSLRKGTENTGRFKKGNIPKHGFEKGLIPWNKGVPATEERKKNMSVSNKGKERKPGLRTGCKAKEWSLKVKERDEWRCKHCGKEEKLHSHHIVPWKDDKELRYDLDNGITLCISCHAKTEGYQKGHVFSEETKKKISETKKGTLPWITGKTHSEETKNKMREARLGVPLSESHRASLMGREVWNKGLEAPEHVKESLAEANRRTWEKRKKENLPGPRKGTKQSEEARRKVSESLKRAYAEGRRVPKGPKKKEVE